MVTALDLKKTKAYLRAEGHRVTPQRMMILRILRDSKKHLSAEELFLKARQNDPGISLATIYRTLALLKEHELVEPRHFEEPVPHYELKPEHEHAHLTCLVCGAVVEFHDETLEKLAEDVATRYGYALLDTGFHLRGICQKCRDKGINLPRH
jgi:Fur family transcriptional regulator, ferric uptake regulator